MRWATDREAERTKEKMNGQAVEICSLTAR